MPSRTPSRDWSPQQEVDDAQGKDLAAEDAVEGANPRWNRCKASLRRPSAKLVHDQAIYRLFADHGAVRRVWSRSVTPT